MEVFCPAQLFFSVILKFPGRGRKNLPHARRNAKLIGPILVERQEALKAAGLPSRYASHEIPPVSDRVENQLWRTPRRVLAGRFLRQILGFDTVPQQSALARDDDHDDDEDHGHDDHDEDGHSREESWIHLLAPYIEHVDKVRICPEDPHADERLDARETSFALNGYLGVVIEAEHGRGKRRRTVVPDGVKKLRQLNSTSKTIAMFETTDQVHLDHVHSYDWFSQDNINSERVYSAVAAEVAVDRHGPAANYLFVDGHVELPPNRSTSGAAKPSTLPSPSNSASRPSIDRSMAGGMNSAVCEWGVWKA